MTEATPTAAPPITRQNARSTMEKGSAEPTALTTNSTAAICITRIRPKRSASPPANQAPAAAPSSARDTVRPVAAVPTVKRSWIALTAPLITDVS